MKMTRRRMRSNVKIEGGGRIKIRSEEEEKECGEGGDRRRRRKRRPEGQEQEEEKGRRRDLCPPFIITHPLSLLSIFSLHLSLLDISYYTHKKCGEDCTCSFGANPSNKSSSKAHNPLTRQSERRSSPHSHLYSPEPHPKICMIHCMIPLYTLLTEVWKEQKMVSLVLWKF